MLILFYILFGLVYEESSINLGDVTFESCVEYEICYVVNNFESTLSTFALSDTLINHDILSSDSLQIENEDWLFHFIDDLGPLYSRLFGCVQFEYLNPTSIDYFFEHFNFDSMEEDILKQMRLRMRHPIVYQRNELPFHRFSNFSVNRSPESPWFGLIAHLTEFCGGNVHEKGLVEITSSSIDNSNC
jgi:hypothetical protein